MNAREMGMTCGANWRNPVSSWRSWKEHGVWDFQMDTSSRRFSNLSCGRLTSMPSVSSMSPHRPNRFFWLESEAKCFP